jgi:hypothetical protein
MWIFKDYKLLSKEEHQKILEIRNEIKIREASRSSHAIPLQDHLQWVDSLDDSQCYFALFIDGEAIGGLNYKTEKEDVKNWGIFFSENAKPLISSLATYIFIEYMLSNYKVLNSEVLRKNSQAVKFNNYFGVNIINEDKEFLYLQLTQGMWDKHKVRLKSLQKRVAMIEYKFKRQEDD